jgi:hypothetical protein
LFPSLPLRGILPAHLGLFNKIRYPYLRIKLFPTHRNRPHPGMSHSPGQTGTGLKRAWTERLRHVAVTRAVAVKALIGANEFRNQKSANCPHQNFCAASVAVYALSPIVGLHT